MTLWKESLLEQLDHSIRESVETSSTVECNSKDPHTTETDVFRQVTLVVTSLRGIAVEGKTPQLDRAYFVSPDAAIFGDVSFDTGVR